jgi:hypothetical protein
LFVLVAENVPTELTDTDETDATLARDAESSDTERLDSLATETDD